VDNQDYISPWFVGAFDIFDWLSEVDEYLITRRYLRTSDGVREIDGTGTIIPLETVDISEAFQSVPYTSAEDEVA
ncbi:hypothetical protein QP277_25860, partial [Escherichia coli]|nr:hypothetical protein [Escherichia coli]